jgi:hypothetical protein
MNSEAIVTRFAKRWCPVLLLGLALLLAACGGASPEPGTQSSPLTFVSLLPTAVPVAPTAPAVDGYAAATPMPPPTSPSNQLVVLHTNDNWGETEPCG